MQKTCTRCSVSQDESQFNWAVSGVRRAARCKRCHSEYRKEHYQKNRQKYIDKARAWEQARGGKSVVNYGITVEQLNILIEKHNGLCWLCQSKPWAHVDHDHECCGDKFWKCGKCVRGLLCNGCNTGLGRFGDNIEGLKLAIEYLEQYICRKH